MSRDHDTSEPSRLSLRLLALIVLALGVLLVILVGISFLIGQAHLHGLQYRLIGAGMLAGAVAVMTITVRHWAPCVSPVCLLGALKALFAAVFGVTISAPHLVTVARRSYALELFLLLAGLAILTFRFVLKPPKSKLDTAALVAAVMGVAWIMVTEPNLWPTRVAAAFLGTAWLVDRGRSSRRKDAETRDSTLK